MFLKTRLKFT